MHRIADWFDFIRATYPLLSENQVRRKARKFAMETCDAERPCRDIAEIVAFSLSKGRRAAAKKFNVSKRTIDRYIAASKHPATVSQERK